MNNERRTFWLRLIILIAVIALTVVLINNREKVQHLGRYGYPGIFLISVFSNATIIIPIPGVIITSAMGAIFNPFLVAITAGAGSAVGELTGYLAGVGGQMVVGDKKWYRKIKRWMAKYGDMTIFTLSFIPNPVLDLAGMIAGSMKIPIWRFIFWCFLGKFLKMLLFAYSGAKLLLLFN